MPRSPVHAPRRAALVDAAIAEIGATGSIDVTVGAIARRAGMSSALAHHYFGSKDRILAAAMRHILRELRAEHLRRLRGAPTPRARLSATITACFAPAGFRPATVAAWLAFYGRAQQGGEERRLLAVYHRRLRANLLFDLRLLTPEAAALAETVAALIDGHYLRAGLGAELADPDRITARIEATLDCLLP
jgi:TetR/AcrR family transcriptional repressor of bet genes